MALHRHWNTENELDDIVSEGVVRDVYEAEIAKELATFFGNNTEMLNNEYPYLFGNLQRILTVWIFLALARVFEEKSPRSPYPIRSIPVYSRATLCSCSDAKHTVALFYDPKVSNNRCQQDLYAQLKFSQPFYVVNLQTGNIRNF